jgi:hypothetical protein
MSKGRAVRLYITWSDEKAQYEYCLEVRIAEYTKYYVYGDLKWARRIADHYNIELPEEL